MSPSRWTHLLFPELSPENLLNDSAVRYGAAESGHRHPLDIIGTAGWLISRSVWWRANNLRSSDRSHHSAAAMSATTGDVTSLNSAGTGLGVLLDFPVF
jgi:hypothetical protein